jgi:hypothetical protein
MSSTHGPPNLELIVEAWKKSIEVQQHFNEICMKIRNYYVSVVSALLALIGVVLSRMADPFFQVWHYQVSVGIPVLAAIVFASVLFYFIDRHWYHRLLVGAVKNAVDIESALGPHIPGIGLTKMIGANSPLDVSGRWAWCWYLLGLLFGADPRVRSDKKIHSDAKIALFYKSVAWFFFAVLVVTVLSGGVHRSPAKGPVATGPQAKSDQTTLRAG